MSEFLLMFYYKEFNKFSVSTEQGCRQFFFKN
jgi:hypothetical protein